MPRRDTIPPELVGPHVAEWARQYEIPNTADGFLSPWEVLSQRTGLDYSYLWKLAKGQQRWRVSFDSADKIFCALGDPLKYWLGDEDLAEHYERIVNEADRIEWGRGQVTEYEREKARRRSREYKARKKLAA